MPIVIAPLNRTLRIIKILAQDKVKKHLESLGLTVDSLITVISNTNGSVILQVRDGRLALDHDIATKILVA